MSLETPKFQRRKPRNRGNLLTKEGSMVGRQTSLVTLRLWPWEIPRCSFIFASDYFVGMIFSGTTIRTNRITNENPRILFCFCFRNGKANEFPQIFFRICFRNDHVGYVQSTTAGHTYEKKIKSQRLSFAFAFVIQQRKSYILGFLFFRS